MSLQAKLAVSSKASWPGQAPNKEGTRGAKAVVSREETASWLSCTKTLEASRTRIKKTKGTKMA